jgi:predicted DCC family thiol-disulfide oxidoreductase YuxK
MAETPAQPTAIVVFDGVCVLCSGWVRFLLARDRARRYRFAAMQSAAGRALLAQHGLDPDDPVSFLLFEDGRAHTDSGAILRILVRLGGAWRLMAIFYAVPPLLRDALYRFVARRRYRWFGRRESCFVPSPDTAHRFMT